MSDKKTVLKHFNPMKLREKYSIKNVNNNYSQAFHRTWQYTHEAYLPVTSNSANRGQGRSIHCTLTPNAGRWYIASELGDNFIQIMEFA